MISDTIAAIATGSVGSGAISIIRISGMDAIGIANKVFTGNDLLVQASHTIHYGHIKCPKTSTVIDEVLVMLMRAPRSFTTEDVIEINCHGGSFVTKLILELILTQGARHAHAGEFSKRAFLNGRINLLEAEAIMDIVEAKSDNALKIAMDTLDGKVTNLINELRKHLLNIIAHIEVNIDYPEYEVEELTKDILLSKSIAIRDLMSKLLHTAQTGQIIKKGIKTAIIGRPNVGKSSLLNQLMREEKAIVTHIAGTTRDAVEGFVNIGGLMLNLIDTAGIQQTSDIVETIGVEKSKKLIHEAELILLVLNSNEALTDVDNALLQETASKKRIILLNKSDLKQQINVCDIPQPFILTSMVDGAGISQLLRSIKLLFEFTEIKSDEVLISNARHIAKLKQSMNSIENAIAQIQVNMPIDMIEIDLKTAWAFLGEIIGENAPELLIDELFTKFCLGK